MKILFCLYIVLGMFSCSFYLLKFNQETHEEPDLMHLTASAIMWPLILPIVVLSDFHPKAINGNG